MANKNSNPEKYWRWLANIWLAVIIFIILIDFWSGNRYSYLIPPISLLYITLLTVYIGSKEFRRWLSYYRGHHPGEIALVIWTALIFVLLVSNTYLGSAYHISTDVVSTYLVVVVLFVASKGSKTIHERYKKR